MPNVVVDANVVVSAALKPNSVPERAIRLACIHDVIALSERVLAEFEEVLSRPKFWHPGWPERREEILDVLLAGAAFFDHGEKVTVCPDEKDNIYLELALAAKAEVIISGDRDLLDLDYWRGIRILRPAQYLEHVVSRPAQRR